MSTAQNLNKLVPERRQVVFGDVTYDIPGDMPTDIFFLAQSAFDEEATEVDMVKRMHQAVCDLLTFYLPGDVEAANQLRNDLRPLGLPTLIKLFFGIYTDEEPATTDDIVDPLETPQVNTTVEATPTMTGDLLNESSQTPSLAIPTPATVPAG